MADILTARAFPVAALAISFFLSPARGAARVEVFYSLPTHSVSLHEPVVMIFNVRNGSSGIVTLELGQDRKEGFLLEVREPTGTTIQLPQLRHEGISTLGTVSIQPGQAFTEELLLNEWYNFREVGSYRVSARLASPISIEGAGNSLQDVSFSGELSIGARDPTRLREICDKLEKQTENATSVEGAQFPARSLSYVQDPVAVPYLARLLSDHTLTYDLAISGLERIGNDAAIEALLFELND